MGWFVFLPDGRADQYRHDVRPAGALVWENDGSIDWPVDLSRVTAEIEGGEIVSVSVAAQPQIYAHISLSGGDGEDPPGVEADNAASKLTVAAKLSQSPTDPDAGLPGGIMFGGAYRITVRRSDGSEYAVQRIQISNNEWSGFFRGKHGTGALHLEQSDMDPVQVDGIGAVDVVLMGDLEMKVYEEADTE